MVGCRSTLHPVRRFRAASIVLVLMRGWKGRVAPGSSATRYRGAEGRSVRWTLPGSCGSRVLRVPP